MSTLMQEIDERSGLAGTNKFELLLFRLGEDKTSGKSELFGINVFKVREAINMPHITSMPGAPPHIMGVANIRGQIIPVIDLPSVAGCRPTSKNFIIVTEFERSVQGFAVEQVEEIVRLHWNRVISAEVHAVGGLVTSLARLDEGDATRLALVLDVERILHDVLPSRLCNPATEAIDTRVDFPDGSVVLYADDSAVARTQIEKTLERMNIPYIGTKTGTEAWERLEALSHEAKTANQRVRDKVAVILSDLEMPEMDGFALTRRIKSDESLRDIPVVIHSSLSGSANESHARSVGAEGYVAKFVPEELARAIKQALAPRSRNQEHCESTPIP